MTIDPKKLVRFAGYGWFTLMCLLVSLYATFPSEAVGQRLAHEIGNATGGKVTASFGSVDLYRLTGFEAEEVRLKVHGDGQPLPLAVDAVRARLRLLPLLWFDVSLAAEIEMGEGTLEAVVHPYDDGGIRFEAEIEDFDLSKPPLLGSFIDLPIGAVVGGKAEGKLAADPKDSSGDVTLTLRDVGVGPGEPVTGFSLPSRIGFGQLDLALTMEAGKVRLAHFQQTAAKPDVQIRAATATATLRQRLAATAYDTCIELKLDPEFVQKNKKFETILDLAQMGPPVGPGLRKDPAGFLHVSLSGTFAGRPTPKRRLCKAGGDGGGAGGDEDSPRARALARRRKAQAGEGGDESAGSEAGASAPAPPGTPGLPMPPIPPPPTPRLGGSLPPPVPHGGPGLPMEMESTGDSEE